MGIGESIKKLRKERNLTQKELGEILNIPFRTIMNWERGIREPSSQNMVLLENYFNVSGAFLRGEINQKEPMLRYEDLEYLKDLEENFPIIIENINNSIKNDTGQNQDLIFKILTELLSILNKKNEKERYLLLNSLANNIYSINELSSIYKSNK